MGDRLDSRFLSQEACRALANRIFAMTTGGGKTRITVDSHWIGGTRWARNLIHTAGERQQSDLNIGRIVRGAYGLARTNILDDPAVRTTVQRAELLTTYQAENPEDYPDTPRLPPPALQPTLWFDATYHVDAPTRAAVADDAISLAEAAHCLAAGYCQVGGHGRALLSTDGPFAYYPYTTAQYSVTIRDPEHQASGWAGVDYSDWRRIDPAALAQRALAKCVQSRQPVAIEPGRYTVILEPQAVCDLLAPLVDAALERVLAEMGSGPFADPHQPGTSLIGQRVIDERLTLGADPMDPDGGFVPFDWEGEPFQPVHWIEQGVLNALAYTRNYGLRQLGKDTGLANSRAFRLSGPAHTDQSTLTVDEMIANTPRGLLVTRFNNIRLLDLSTMLLTGNTRDGLWLIERGKIMKAVKNLRFTESPLYVLNNVEAIGHPQRVFRPEAPAIVPPLMARDFSFTGLMDAV